MVENGEINAFTLTHHNYFLCLKLRHSRIDKSFSIVIIFNQSFFEIPKILLPWIIRH